MKKIAIIITLVLAIFGTSVQTFAGTDPMTWIYSSQLTAGGAAERMLNDYKNGDFPYWTIVNEGSNYYSIYGSNVKGEVYESVTGTWHIRLKSQTGYTTEQRTYYRAQVYNPTSTHQIIKNQTYVLSETGSQNMSVTAINITSVPYVNYYVEWQGNVINPNNFYIETETIDATGVGKDTISWTNTDTVIRTITLRSIGTSNVTINSPAKYSGTSNIGTTKQPFTLNPNETFTVTRNSGDEIVLELKPYLQPPVTQLPTQYIVISNPPDNWTTVDKTISYMVTYSVTATSASDVNISVRDANGNSLDSNINVKDYELYNHIAKVTNGTLNGSFTLRVNYQNVFVGVEGITVKVETPTHLVADTKTITIQAFIDSDGDGIDDETGDDPYQPPKEIDEGINRDNYTDDIIGEVSYQFDRIMYLVTTPFRWIGESIKSVFEWFDESESWISGFGNIFTALFGWLPEPIVGMMVMLFTVIMIFTVIRVVRG